MCPFLFLVTDKFTESMYVLANEPSVALYRLQEHVRRSLPELAQHKVNCVANPKQAAGKILTPQSHKQQRLPSTCVVQQCVLLQTTALNLFLHVTSEAGRWFAQPVSICVLGNTVGGVRMEWSRF